MQPSHSILPSTPEEIEDIHFLIKPHIINTPVISSEAINQLLGGEIYFKCENFQKIGAFKARGAVHAVKRMSEDQLKNGVATHSSGNHAQALAYAAKMAGVKAFIVMPENSARVKLDGVKRLGAEIILCGNTQQDREAALEKIVRETGAFFIPPYNHEWVIGGQGTAAKELFEEISAIDSIVAPVGGGGLLSGTALTCALMETGISVYGAEPENVNDAQRSFRSGTIEGNTASNTVADGLRTQLGDLTFSCIKSHVTDILTATEEEIVDAMKLVWQNLKITAEPSSCVPLAVIMKHPELFRGKKTGIIISGGNVDLQSLPF